MREIKKEGRTLARLIQPEDIKAGLNFFSEDSEYIQVGVWGHYEKGKELAAHIHNPVERVALRTCEVLYIISGRIEATIYDLDENYVEKVMVNAGEILVLLESGHGYRILEEDTTVLEVKNGPYLGAEKDRYRLEG